MTALVLLGSQLSSPTATRQTEAERIKAALDARGLSKAPDVAARKDPEVLRQEAERLMRATVSTMDRKEALEFFAAQLLEQCRSQNRHLNYITVVKRKAAGGTALYCVHDFYSQYSFSSGSLGPAIAQFVEHWGAELQQHKVTRVGVWGPEADDSGVWFRVK